MASFGFLGIFIYLLIYGFIAYFLINVLQFMRRKTRSDKLLLQKLDELSRKLDQQTEDNSK